MTPERWKQVEELYHAAQTRPSGERDAFLAQACGDDSALCAEVASLLSEPESEDDFLHGSVVLGGHSPADKPPALMTGHSLGGYRLEALLGSGGMGEVYRSRDTNLARDVAIKILPGAFTRDPDRLARLSREARMLAALHHPNICAIYGFEEAEGVRFLVLELVEGDTLAEVIRRSPANAGVPVRDALGIARQLADALEVAHDKGIIHRDLKPANIKLTAEGVVKVLDFGLAKNVGLDEGGGERAHTGTADGATREGLVLGTAAYMSPEQARGLPVDRRTDIWAFGCVLFELLTGHAVFAGDTISDTIVRILDREPDWELLPGPTPINVRRLLVRCLTKDPKRRLRDIGDARIEIDALPEVRPGVSDGDLPSTTPSRTARWLPWVAVAALVAGVAVVESRRGSVRRDNPLENARITLLTPWQSTQGSAEISPDGRFVIFLSDRDQRFDLWRTQVGSGLFVNLTAGMPAQRAPSPLHRMFGFAADGADVWFADAGGPLLRKLLMPMTGGTPRPFLGRENAPAWSHDGKQTVYMQIPVNLEAGDPLFVADGTAANARQILAPEPKIHNHNPIWSIDDRWIYFVRGPDPSGAMDIWRIRPAGGAPERLTHLNTAVNFLAVLDHRTILYVAREADWSGPWLWSLDLDTGDTRRAAIGLEKYTSVAASADGRRVVATVANPVASLWKIPLLGSVASEADVQPYPLPVPTERALGPRFRGTSLFYLAGSGTGEGLWRLQDQVATEVRRGAGAGLTEPAAVSSDGSRVVIVVSERGERHLSIMSADGTNARSLATSIAITGTAGQAMADWSPDGAFIVASGRDAAGQALFKIPVTGGEPVRLVSGEAYHPVWSPDGRLIVYETGLGAQVSLLGVRPDGTRVVLPDLSARPGGTRFLPDSSGLVYLPFMHSRDFMLLDLRTMKSRTIASLEDRGALTTFDITPDGQFMVFDRSRENSNIVLFELPAK